MTRPASERPEEVQELAGEGRLITVTVGKPAHGGTFVARHDGRVVFVRGACPGETVVAELLPESSSNARFWRAETIDVIEAGPDRVPSAWPESGYEGIGGADYAHIRIEAQRRIKTEVLQELMTRARITSYPIEDIQIEPARDDHTGLGWRSRVRFAVDNGKVGMRGWRSHDIHAVGSNPLAHPVIQGLGIGVWKAPSGVVAVDVAAPSGSSPAIIVRAEKELSLEELNLPAGCDKASVLLTTRKATTTLRGDDTVREIVGDDIFTLYAGGFWQVHVDAPRLLTGAVGQALDAREGECVWDLYAGAGLFSVPAARAVGAEGELVSVEGAERASADAASNLAAYPQARTVSADVRDFLARSTEGADRVVMDPPRAGVGEAAMARLAELTRTRMVYVSCEPSTLARDLRVAEHEGWAITDFQVFDLYPHTHHMECVVKLERAAR